MSFVHPQNQLLIARRSLPVLGWAPRTPKEMGKNTRDKQIAATRHAVGWVYDDLPWFSEQEAIEANRIRNELLEALSGWVSYSFQGTKLHSGPLSPGCTICGQGGWACNFINTLCTRNCFYCPQNRRVKEERESRADGILLKVPDDYVDFIKTFKIRGVGFSGGEPLLALDKLSPIITTIRQEFGAAIYLWMYTNGDLIDQHALRQLQLAGLDEIRFDLSARGYDLTPVQMSRGYIPTVTIEIPAIPEDFDLVSGLLVKMQELGVDFLNLHQLAVSKHNYKILGRRKYHFLHQPSIPVFESELCALRLLLYARQQRLKLPINYCCSAYKNRFQRRDIGTRIGNVVRQGFEEVTDCGYLRSFRIRDSKDKIEGVVRKFVKANRSSVLWQCNDTGTEISIHQDLLEFVDWSSADVMLVYSEPGVAVRNPELPIRKDNLISKNFVVYQESGWSQAAIESWRKHYLQKISMPDAVKYFFQNYQAYGKHSNLELRRQTEELKKLARWEEVESGLPDVF